MKAMVVEEGEGELFFVCQGLEALGVQIIHSRSLDEDKVILHNIEVVVHIWTSFTAGSEAIQIQGMYEAKPDLVVIIFAPAQDVPGLRRQFRSALVADKRALDAASAARTAQAAVQEVRKKQAEAAAAKA